MSSACRDSRPGSGGIDGSRLSIAECEQEVESPSRYLVDKLVRPVLAKEFLRTLIQKYLCDELCHKKWGEKSFSEL